MLQKDLKYITTNKQMPEVGKYVAPTHHYGDITAMVKRDSVECDGGLALKE